jgi:hypothetical protein
MKEHDNHSFNPKQDYKYKVKPLIDFLEGYYREGTYTVIDYEELNRGLGRCRHRG